MKKLIPFSNGSEACSWIDDNCDKCKRSWCYAKTSIQMGFVTGTITIRQAEWIGYVSITQDKFVNLLAKCSKFNIPKPVKKKPKVDDNLTLF